MYVLAQWGGPGVRLGPSLLASHYAALYVSFMILYELCLELGILVSRTNHLDVWKNFFFK